MVQRVKDPALPQLWQRSQLQLGLDPWPRNFHMPWVQPKKKNYTRFPEFDTKQKKVNWKRLMIPK